MDARIIKAVI